MSGEKYGPQEGGVAIMVGYTLMVMGTVISWMCVRGQQYSETGYGNKNGTSGTIDAWVGALGLPQPHFNLTDGYNVASAIFASLATVLVALSFGGWLRNLVSGGYYTWINAYYTFYFNTVASFFLLIAMATGLSSTYDATQDNDYYNYNHNQVPGTSARVEGSTAYTQWTWSKVVGSATVTANPTLYMNLVFGMVLLAMQGYAHLITLGIFSPFNWASYWQIRLWLLMTGRYEDFGSYPSSQDRYAWIFRHMLITGVMSFFALMCLGYDTWRFTPASNAGTLRFVYDEATASLTFFCVAAVGLITMGVGFAVKGDGHLGTTLQVLTQA